jgi:predicted RNA binding protein YcfA (HicA-like mRNA interferase family)
MKRYSSREVLKMLLDDGWYEVDCVGDHHQFKHPKKPGKVTLRYPVKDLSIRDLKSIERQSGLQF